ncbi:MAG: ABC transporter permease [Lachnospiraceae bacterium]
MTRSKQVQSRAGKKIKAVLFGSLSTILFLLAWYLLAVTGILNTGIIPDPISVIGRLFTNLFTTDLFMTHIVLTLRRAALGFISAFVGGLAGALLISTVFKRQLDGILPIFHFLEKLNPLALFPVFMLFWGIGETSKILIIFWVAVWPVTFHTIDGIRNVDAGLLKSARAMGASGRAAFFKVTLPAALPDIFVGVKLALQIAFMFIISIELLSSSAGLGWFLLNARLQYNLPNVYSSVILVGIVGIIIDVLCNVLWKKLFKWKEEVIK